jgi:AraC-like DNA-binding protein
MNDLRLNLSIARLADDSEVRPEFRSVRFSIAHLPERQRIAAWREHYARTALRVDIEPHDDAPFDCILTSCALPDLQILLGEMSAVRVSRTRELAADGNDDLALIINRSGTLAGSGRGHEVVLGHGDAVLMSSDEASVFQRNASGSSLALRVPRAVLVDNVIGLDDLIMRPIPRATAALRLLASYTGALLDDELVGLPEIRPTVVTHIHDLVALTVGATAEAAERSEVGGVPAARLKLAKIFVARNSERQALAVRHVAEHLRLAERTVQQLFERDGTTFSAFLLAQRLSRARRMLIDPKHDSRAISTIAYEVGFGDLSYFNRSFKQRYGATPREVRLSSQNQASLTGKSTASSSL